MNVLINIDPKQAKPIYRQIVDELINAIAEGYLKPGEKLPSTRDLGKTLGISRFTVMRSFEDLVSAGYIKIATGSGAFVNPDLGHGSAQNNPSDEQHNFAATDTLAQAGSVAMAIEGRGLSRFAAQVAKATQFEPNAIDEHAQLNYGTPAFDLLPVNRWKEVLYAATREVQTERADLHQQTFGRPQLRSALADYLSRSRRVRCHADRVAIFTSWQSAIDFVLRLVIDPGDEVALESPAQPRLYRSVLASGATVHPIALDNSGMTARALSTVENPLKLICLNPSRNEGTGLTMSAFRRREILQEAEQQNSYIIENDRDHEFRYGQKAVPSLQGMDTSDRVIYVGTVADVLAPLCRLAYVVLPNHLVEAAREMKALIEPDFAPVDQLALANFIGDGHFERHIKRSNEVYAERRAALVHALTANFGENMRILSAGSGTNIVVRFHHNFNRVQIDQAATKYDISLVNGGTYYPTDPNCNHYLLGFGHLSLDKIRQDIALLAGEINQPLMPLPVMSAAGLMHMR